MQGLFVHTLVIYEIGYVTHYSSFITSYLSIPLSSHILMQSNSFILKASLVINEFENNFSQIEYHNRTQSLHLKTCLLTLVRH